MSKKSFGRHYLGRVDSFNESTYNQPRQFFGVQDSTFEGRSVSQSCVQTDTPSERYKGLRASDFALENQLKVGMPLEPIKLSPSIGDITESISNVKLSKIQVNEQNQETQQAV